MPSDLSIIVPCYNSGDWLHRLVERIESSVSHTGYSFEIVLVNDGSSDKTWFQMERLAARYPRVRGLDLQYNVGQYLATICGMEHAEGELILTMDDDFQHSPEDIPTLLAAFDEEPGTDVVVARFRRRQTSWIRRTGTACRELILEKLYGKPRDLWLSGFRVMNRSTAEAICAHRTSQPILLPILLKCAKNIRNVSVEHQVRSQGSSGYSYGRLAGLLWRNVVFGSTLPLRLVGCVGLIIAAFATLFAIYYLTQYLLGEIQWPGFATLVLLNLFFGGSMLFAIGIVGEYLVRIVGEVSRPPRYYVRRTTGRSETAAREDNRDENGLPVADESLH